MKLIFPIGIRLYDGGLAIAETLGDLELSAAAADAEQAREKLRQACCHTLERTHPRLLARMGRAPKPRIQKLALPALVRRADQWRSGGKASEYLARPTYVLE